MGAASLGLGLVLLAAAGAAGDGPVAVDARLRVERFAAEPDVVTPVGVAVDRDGRVFVVESHTHFRPPDYPGPPADRIRLLEDRDGDGRAERVSTFFEGSKYTMGLGFHPDSGALFVATRWEVFRLTDADRDGRADGPPARLVRLETPGDYPHNGLSGFAFDAAGLVYFGLGENLGAAYKLVGSDGTTLAGGGEGGNVYRCRPDGSKLERVATGFWNPFALAFDPFGRLFCVDNDPDSRPPCRLLHVVAGGDYGYRFRNGRKGLHPFTAWNGELPGTLPMVAGTGEAPSGVVVYGSDNLPADYRGTVLATSWGDHRIDRFDPKPAGASVTAASKPVVTGGEDFRPVSLAVAPDGSLYATDWVDKSYTLHRKGRVWHIRAAQPPARVAVRSDADALRLDDRATREAAARRLAATEAGRATLRAALAESSSPLTRAVAVDHLANAPTPADTASLRAALADRDEGVRLLAVKRAPDGLVDAAKVAASDASATVRAEAMRGVHGPGAESVLLKALEDADPFTRQAAREGLKRSLPVGRLREVAGQDTNPAHRLGALVALRDLDTPEARQAVAGALDDADPDVAFAAVQWVAESKLADQRGRVEARLASGSLTQTLFEAVLAALERLDDRGGPRDPRVERPGEAYVAALLDDPKLAKSAAVVRRTLRALRPDHPAITPTRLDAWLASDDPGVRLEALRTLRDGGRPGRFDRLAALARGRSVPAALRAEAVVGLADADLSDATRRAALVDLATDPEPAVRHEALRSLRGAPLTPAERDRLAKSAPDDPETAPLVALLGGTPAPGGPTGSDSLASWLKTLDGPADPAAGARVFAHAKGPGCVRCHAVEGRGGRVGPDLSATGSVLTRERLVESILNPSKEVAPQFTAWSVALKDGRVITGTLQRESEAGRVYADAQGRLVTVKPDEIEEAKPLTESIMPADLSRLMTPQEFRDLIAFLREPKGR